MAEVRRQFIKSRSVKQNTNYKLNTCTTVNGGDVLNGHSPVYGT